MKALTIRQPWAYAIVHGAKRVENRIWRTHYRGPLLIHAGSKRCPEGVELPDGHQVPAGALVFGAIIGVAELIDCIPIAELQPGPFVEGPFCWILDKVRAIEPIPYTGQQQLYNVPDGLISSALASPPARSRTRAPRHG